LNQILKRQTSRSHYGSKVPAVTITVFKYRNKISKIVVKAVPYKKTHIIDVLGVIFFLNKAIKVY
jgi:hypothetical protein